MNNLLDRYDISNTGFNMTKNRKFNIFFWFIIIGYIFYAALYIFRTSFMVGNERYFVLFDDAMISMRYAKHLAEGYGPVWNIGETPVEGYTNPLWMVFMSIFHFFPIPASKTSLTIQICGAIFLLLNLFYVKRLTELLTNNKIVPLLATLLTALYIPLNNWGLQGMEVSILVLLLSLSLFLIFNEKKQEQFSPIPYILLGIGTLIRLDMSLPYVLILGFQLWVNPKHRRQIFFWGFGILVGFQTTLTLIRYFYYGDIFPNTYYLKVVGFPIIPRIKRGFLVFWNFVFAMNWLIFLIPFSAILFKRDRLTTLATLLILGQITYSVYVGGDAWEHTGGSNRYISIVMPFFFMLFAYASEQIVRAITTTINGNQVVARSIINFCLFFLVIAGMVNINYIYKLRRTFGVWFLDRQPMFVEGNIENIHIVEAITKVTTSDAQLAVVSAGVIPYFSERPSIDLLGKNDYHIARVSNYVPQNIEKIRPGHMKWDYDYAIGDLKPDMVVQLWGDTHVAEKYIKQFYTVIEVDGFFFSARTDSDQILWEDVNIVPDSSSNE
jgi:arabinofuranosyltransferase